MSANLEADRRASDQADANELIERQRLRIAELEERLEELAELKHRLLETEQQLAGLPELRRRSERLEELESSALVRFTTRARARARLSADLSTRSVRGRIKELIAAVSQRITGAGP